MFANLKAWFTAHIENPANQVAKDLEAEVVAEWDSVVERIEALEQKVGITPPAMGPESTVPAAVARKKISPVK